MTLQSLISKGNTTHKNQKKKTLKPSHIHWFIGVQSLTKFVNWKARIGANGIIRVKFAHVTLLWWIIFYYLKSTGSAC
jgi:hypothetical protein